MTEQPDAERSIFLAAVEAGSPADRAAYLDRACGGDGRLLAGVEELLAAHDRLGAYDPATAVHHPAAPGGVATTASYPVGEGPGAVVGPYKLLERIGEGGWGPSTWPSRSARSAARWP